MVKIGDYVYIKDKSATVSEAKHKKWIFKVSSIEDGKASLTWTHPKHLTESPMTLPVEDIAPVTYPEIGDTVSIVSNNVPDIYGDMSGSIGNVGIVKEYGSAKKSVVIELDNGALLKVHMADIGYSIPKQNPRKLPSSFEECPAKLISEKEAVQKCLVMDFGNKYYDVKWEDKSLAPRKEMERCVQSVMETADIAEACFNMSPKKTKDELKQRHKWLKSRVKKAKKEFASKPRKFCNNEKVIKFKDMDDISDFAFIGDAKAGGDGKAYSLNMITNDMHVMGLAMQKVSGKHCGCKLTDFNVLNPYHYGYCEGVSGGGVQKGTSIHHKLGIHHVQIDLLEDGAGGADVKVHYTDSVGYKGSKARMKGIMKLLKKEHKMKCEVVDAHANIIHCEGKLTEPKQAKTLAMFFAGTLNYDLKTSKQSIMDEHLTKLMSGSAEKAEEGGCQKPPSIGSIWG